MDTYALVDSSSNPLSGIYTGTGSSNVDPTQTTTRKFGSRAVKFAANNSNVVIPADARFDVGSSHWPGRCGCKRRMMVPSIDLGS